MVFLLVASIVTFFLFLEFLYRKCFGEKKVIFGGYEEEWFGRGPRPSKEENGDLENDTSIRPFKVQVPDEVLSDLKRRLENTRFEESLEEKDFEYGFHAEYLHEVIEYWKTQYQWRKQEEDLNKYSQFKTRIEGIDVHFVHVKPTIPEGKNLKVIPLLVVHGWPGSVLEFYKMIPLITSERPGHNFVFEVICPSIPGYGFSEAPHHKGFNQLSAARIFFTLMARLGHSQFYVQGGDWGSFICTLMSKLYPTKVRGLHVNMFPAQLGLGMCFKYVLIYLFPSLVTPQEYAAIFPIKKHIGTLLQESGYFHIQSTKPDTVGCGTADSPVGLAAYILEKFSSWTNLENRELPDGGLTRKFTLDELLTNVMIYWINNNIKSSTRFYKEYIRGEMVRAYDSKPITVPCGVAVFPHDIARTCKWIISKGLVKNLVSYTWMPQGGHFAAMEEPQLMADDVWKFVNLVEKQSQ